MPTRTLYRAAFIMISEQPMPYRKYGATVLTIPCTRKFLHHVFILGAHQCLIERQNDMQEVLPYRRVCPNRT